MELYLSESSTEDGYNSTTITTCAESSINALKVTDVPLYLDIGVRAVNVVMAEVILLLVNFLNVLTLILIGRYKELHTMPFAIAAQIAISNIIKAGALSFPSVINNIAGQWVLGMPMCTVCAFLRYLCSVVRGILFLTFSFDRFSAVFFPFTYPRYSHKIMVITCTLSWLVSLSVSLAPLPKVLDCYGFVEVNKDCHLIRGCSKGCQIFTIMWAYLLYFPSAFVAAGLFIALYLKGRKIRIKESQMLGQSNKTISDSDWRALKTISILFWCFFVVSFIPFILALVLERVGGVEGYLILQFLLVFGNMTFVTDSVIILRNVDARQACKKLRSDIKEVWRKRYKAHFQN